MKANARYTAQEIIEMSGLEVPANLFGGYRLRIGGISVNNPNHLINIPAGTNTLEVIVGNESFDLDIEESAEDRETSELAMEVLNTERKQEIEAKNELRESQKAKQDK